MALFRREDARNSHETPPGHLTRQGVANKGLPVLKGASATLRTLMI
jgi:hypothetical protein